MRSIAGRKRLDVPGSMVYQEPMASLNPAMKIARQLMEVPIVHEGIGEKDGITEGAETEPGRGGKPVGGRDGSATGATTTGAADWPAPPDRTSWSMETWYEESLAMRAAISVSEVGVWMFIEVFVLEGRLGWGCAGA